MRSVPVRGPEEDGLGRRHELQPSQVSSPASWSLGGLWTSLNHAELTGVWFESPARGRGFAV